MKKLKLLYTIGLLFIATMSIISLHAQEMSLSEMAGLSGNAGRRASRLKLESMSRRSSQPIKPSNDEQEPQEISSFATSYSGLMSSVAKSEDTGEMSLQDLSLSSMDFVKTELPSLNPELLVQESIDSDLKMENGVKGENSPDITLQLYASSKNKVKGVYQIVTVREEDGNKCGYYALDKGVAITLDLLGIDRRISSLKQLLVKRVKRDRKISLYQQYLAQQLEKTIGSHCPEKIAQTYKNAFTEVAKKLAQQQDAKSKQDVVCIKQEDVIRELRSELINGAAKAQEQELIAFYNKLSQMKTISQFLKIGLIKFSVSSEGDRPHIVSIDENGSKTRFEIPSQWLNLPLKDYLKGFWLTREELQAGFAIAQEKKEELGKIGFLCLGDMNIPVADQLRLETELETAFFDKNKKIKIIMCFSHGHWFTCVVRHRPKKTFYYVADSTGREVINHELINEIHALLTNPETFYLSEQAESTAEDLPKIDTLEISSSDTSIMPDESEAESEEYIDDLEEDHNGQEEIFKNNFD